MRAQLPNSLFILLAVMMFYGPPGGMRALGATPSGHDQTAMKLELRSNSFQHEGKIPREFTCEGKNASPQLEWSNAPADTQTFVLILQDPDAPRGTFIHWVVYNLPSTSRGLPEGVPQQAQLAGGGMQGRNDFGKTGYGGPCPPPGKPHRYFFRVYALKSSLKLPADASAEDVQRAMTGQVLATAELMGRFGR